MPGAFLSSVDAHLAGGDGALVKLSLFGLFARAGALLPLTAWLALQPEMPAFGEALSTAR